MYLLYANVTFNNKNARDRGVRAAEAEAANRGLVPTTFTWDGVAITGAQPQGNTGLLLSFAGPFQAVEDAHNALQIYLDANGRVDGIAGTMWLNDN